MFRKDADLATFIDAIKYERELWAQKNRKKKKQNKNSFDYRDQAIKRRVIHLYQRATRKFKHNLPLWKEYLHFLFQCRATQKLNRTIAQVLQLHPTTIDFWLIAAYNELELKGNLFSGRKILLQALRNNSKSAMLYVEYLRFEIALLHKVKDRRKILTGQAEDKLDFVDGEGDSNMDEQAEPEGDLVQASQ